jgi:hypothetical protein
VIPTTVVSHFLKDFERNEKYTGEILLYIVYMVYSVMPCSGIETQFVEFDVDKQCMPANFKDQASSKNFMFLF